MQKAATTPNILQSNSQRSTQNFAFERVFDFAVIEERPGFVIIEVSGKGAAATFKDESGGHRWQAVSPTEKRGRVQTSTITVAVLPQPTEAQVHISEGDLEFSACRGSGAGGQHRNVTDSAVILKHKATGITVRCETERSQHQNKATALALLRARLWEAKQEEINGNRSEDRKRQVGSGMRGDKRRTIRVQDGQVNDHLTGRTWQYKSYARGIWD